MDISKTTTSQQEEPSSRRGGGPRTAEGKAASRKNALKHGLTAAKLLPEVLKPGTVEQYEKELLSEYNPATFTEKFLVAELARHAAVLDFGQEAECAVLRHGALELAQVVLRGEPWDLTDRDAILSAAVATDTLERFSRYRRTHEKAFFAALNKLHEMKEAREEVAEKVHEAAGCHFQTETACKSYLERRFQRTDHRCPHCESRSGRWLASRSRWRCDGCKRQLGLRAGTVMAGSHVPLVAWFRAIGMLLKRPTATTAELIRHTGIERAATVRKMAGKIRGAMGTENATELLAGLDQQYLGRKENPR